ncbi:MAG TPA: hypothetical protein VFF87_02075 [Hyphomicrobium sp.]|nr:hypothetical protein [Hyphomicrobium sp.]
MSRNFHLIDPPSPLAPDAEWREHLDGLRKERNKYPSPQLDEAIADAEEELARRREQKPED